MCGIEQFEGENASLSQQLEAARGIISAAENLVKVKGRHHSEIAYTKLIEALNARRQ